MYVCVHLCMCMSEREREREKVGDNLIYHESVSMFVHPKVSPNEHTYIVWLIGRVLRHINPCSLFNAESSSYIYYIYI